MYRMKCYRTDYLQPSFSRAYKKAIMKSVVVRSAMSIGQPLLLIMQTVMSPIIFSHPCVLNQRNGEYAGSMHTGASSGAETIRGNVEMLEYQIQGNQRCYCAVHTRQQRMYGIMPYAVWNMPYWSVSTTTIYSRNFPTINNSACVQCCLT